MGLLIITRGLELTGVMHWVARQLQTYGRGSEAKLVALVMAAGAAVSLIMNNVAAGAVLLPAVTRVARETGVAPSKLLIPLSFGVMAGGMATYLTTANILMSELLLAQGFAGLGMLDFVPVGSIVVAGSVPYMALLGRRWLPERASLFQIFDQPDLRETYELGKRMWLARIVQGSILIERRVQDSAINTELGMTVAAVWRGEETIAIPKSQLRMRAGDELLIIGQAAQLDDLLACGVRLIKDEALAAAGEERHWQRRPLSQMLAWGNRLRGGDYQAEPGDLPLEPVEIMIPSRSNAIGKTLSALKLNRDEGLLAIALWRDGSVIDRNVRKEPLRVGDAILAVGKPEDIQQLSRNPNFAIPAGEYAAEPIQWDKAPVAVLITALALALAILKLLPLSIAMLAGAAAMTLFGCLKMDQFYGAIDWRAIFLVAGMLPLSLAITNSGLADRLGAIMVASLADASPLLLVGVIAALTMLVTQVIGGQVTPLLVGPIAITAALQIGVDPRAMALAVAMACSMAFLTPIAHPVNILMMGPGGYRFSDFSKVGFGMTAVTMLTMLLGLALLWGV